MPDISNMFGMSQSATRAAEGASVAQKAAQIVAEQGPASPPLEDEAQGGAGDEGKDYGDRELSEGATKNTVRRFSLCNNVLINFCSLWTAPSRGL
eukprot:768818-Hanusia_phi.AAC.6